MSIFKVSEEEGNIVVEVSLLPYDPMKTPRKKVSTGDVENHLRENSIKFGKCIQPSGLNNRNPDQLNGIWIFEKKLLDKPAERVILTKEKRPATKKKSRAKKTTSK